MLNESLDVKNESFEFIYNIWADILGSDSFDETLFEVGTIDPLLSAGTGDGASLFTRIGNHGYNESSADQTLLDDVSNISAGWRVEFPVQADYNVINISFKWRYDCLDGAFDNYTALDGHPDVVIESSPDYQEIRCRIVSPTSSDNSFWIGDDSTPNKSVFYRVGPNVTEDEVWHYFEGNFHVPQDSSNYTLELGAYLNTREYWNEYFDVWFDDILILGLNDIPDENPPQPYDFGLIRTQNKSRFLIWAEFFEGKWESSINNITVFYNQTSDSYDISSNESLKCVNFNITNAGYNQSHWEEFIDVDFNDTINYYFLVFDKANNSFQTEINTLIIWDFIPPEIIGTNRDDNDPTGFVFQYGNGTIVISINVSDWGFGVSEIVLNYSINGETYLTYDMIEGNTYNDSFTTFYAILKDISYESKIEFSFYLNDVQDNSQIYPRDSEYYIISEVDTVFPLIDPDEFHIEPSTIIEGHTNVTVMATDSFGEIDDVLLSVVSGNGIIVYQNISLTNSSTPGLYIVRVMEGVKALKLPYDPNYGEYSITIIVRDKAGRTSSLTKNYVVPDIISPKVEEDRRLWRKEYLTPTLLVITVQITDFGSGVDKVFLERKIKGQWINLSEMKPDPENPYLFSYTIHTDWFGNQLIEYRIYARDKEGNELLADERPIDQYQTRIFFATTIGLLITEIIAVTLIVGIFSAIRLAQRQRLKVKRRARFDVALLRSERLAYLGEEAMFGFLSAFGQQEGVSSILTWEPRMIGNFYQYLKELADKAINNVSFVMQTKPDDIVTFIDFRIEEIGCSAITFAYPVSTLPQRWLSTLTLDQVPMGAGQGVLLLMLLMREKWSEISYDFKEEIADGMVELKDLILAGEDKEAIIRKVREFRLFISGTVEVLDEIDTEVDEMADEIMGDFETEFLDTDSDTETQDESSPDDATDDHSDAIMGDFEKDFLDTDSSEDEDNKD